MATTTLGRVVAGVLLGFMLGIAPARAQITVEPQSLDVTVSQYADEARTLTLTNDGEEVIDYCLSFSRPLEEGPEGLVLSPDAISSACGTYGEVLLQVSQQDYPISWNPYGITMTPNGRILAADYSSHNRTHELTPELELVRSFEHPTFAGCYPFPATTGVTYNADTGTLWWMNIDAGGFDVCSALLLEGDLDGVPTGRQIEVPIAETAPEPYEGGSPVGASYDAATKRYYFIDFANDDIWAVDTLGNVIDGYPVVQQAYPESNTGYGIDAHRGVEPETSGLEGLWLEEGTNRPGDFRVTRIVALDAEGVWSGIETPTPILDETGSKINGNPLRSRLDPNGVMYYAYSSFDLRGVVAVRPHPLPPRWLSVDSVGTAPPAWDGTLEAGDSVEVPLTFQAGSREIGTYEAALQVFEAESGEAVEVPLTLSVTPGVDAEESPEPERETRLSVYPNPSFGEATVALTLAEAAEVRVAVFDVLGREVAVLHEGSMAAGERALAFETARLPSGLYLVRAKGETFSASLRMTVVR